LRSLFDLSTRLDDDGYSFFEWRTHPFPQLLLVPLALRLKNFVCDLGLSFPLLFFFLQQSDFFAGPLRPSRGDNYTRSFPSCIPERSLSSSTRDILIVSLFILPPMRISLTLLLYPPLFRGSPDRFRLSFLSLGRPPRPTALCFTSPDAGFRADSRSLIDASYSLD